jgi:hypothetical protein
VSSRRTRVRPAQELAEWQRLRARGDWDYHVSPSTNRASILRHGLDITWMSGIGIAGSTSAEVEGIFIAQSLWEAFYFAGFGVHERVDVWSVDARGLRLLQDGGGYLFYPGAIGPERLRLVEADLDPVTASARLDEPES